MSTPSIQTRLQAALALQRAGQFAQAIDDYLDILSQHPDQHDAHHQLGVAYWNHGQQEVALTHLQRALQAPQVPGGYWLAVVDALTGLGRHSEAQHWLVKARQRGLPASAASSSPRSFCTLARLPCSSAMSGACCSAAR